jgi:hypothetical protein
VGAANCSEGPWERTFNCEDSDKDLRDFWALILEGSGRTKLPVLCAPFIALDAKGEPVFAMLHQPPYEKTGAAGASAASGNFESLTLEGGKSGLVWASLQQHVQCWPRVAIKRRVTDASSEKTSKGLSSTQLLLAQLVSGSNLSNPLEVAKQFRHELVPRQHAANIASASPHP